VAVPAIFPLAFQRVIAVAGIKRRAAGNALHHGTQLVFDRSSLYPPPKITPELTF
jgi:hypothetical protein